MDPAASRLRAADKMARFHEAGNAETKATLDEYWTDFIRASREGKLLAHPRTQPVGPTKVVYQKPVYGVSTAAYKDVAETIKAVKAFHIDELGHSCVGVVGDWQTFNRMWHLKIQEGDGDALDWLIPLPGEFHFTWHCAQALYKLFWLQLLSWAATAANMTKSMKAPNEMDCTDNIKYIDHFMQLMIMSTTQYLCDLFGEEYLLQVSYDDIVTEWSQKSLGAWARATMLDSYTQWRLYEHLLTRSRAQV